MTEELVSVQAIIDADDLPCFALDRELRYTAFNRAHADVMRALYGADIALGGRLPDYQTAPADRETSAADLERALAGERVTATAFSGENESRRCLEVVHEPQTDPHGTVVGVVVRTYDVTGSKQAEEALVRSQLLLQSSLESQKDTILFSIDHDYRYLYFNKAHSDVMRSAYGKDIALGMYILDCITSDEDRVVAKQNYDRALSGESHTNVRVFGDLELAYYESFFNPVLTESGEIIGATGLARDITERVHAEQALQQSQALLQAAMDRSQAGIAIADAPDGRLRYVNEAALLIRGSTADQVVDQVDAARYVESWHILHHDGTPYAPDEVPLARAVLYGETSEAESIIRRDDHEDRIVLARAAPIRDAEGAVTAGVVVFHDITERKQAEEELTHSHDLLANLARLVPGVIYQYRLYPDGSSAFPYSSPGMNDIYECTPEEVREDATPVFGRLHPDDAERVGDLIQESARTLDEFYCEFRVVLPRQGLRWRWSQAHPERTEDGGTLWHGIISDITERKQAEEEIQHLNSDLEDRVQRRTAELKAANKELEAFAYSVSHDLRAPLRHISGYASILRSDAEDALDEDGRRCLDTITDSAREMGVLIDDLLQFSRIGRAEMEVGDVDMGLVLEEALTPIRDDAQGRAIEWSVGPLPHVEGDPALLRQVWTNLVGNAVKYSRDRDPARIEVGAGDGHEPGASDASSEQVFFVRDNGVGFDMQYAHKLFGVFQRLHGPAEFEGTGIGLANVHRIITRHGGRVWAEAAVDEGATFYFALPRDRGAP